MELLNDGLLGEVYGGASQVILGKNAALLYPKTTKICTTCGKNYEVYTGSMGLRGDLYSDIMKHCKDCRIYDSNGSSRIKFSTDIKADSETKN